MGLSGTRWDRPLSETSLSNVESFSHIQREFQIVKIKRQIAKTILRQQRALILLALNQAPAYKLNNLVITEYFFLTGLACDNKRLIKTASKMDRQNLIKLFKVNNDLFVFELTQTGQNMIGHNNKYLDFPLALARAIEDN